MATTLSCTYTQSFHPPVHGNGGESSVFGRNNLQFLQRCPQLRAARTSKGSKKGLVVRSATPEVATDAISSSFPLPSIPGVTDNPWITGVAGLLVGVPFLIQKLVTLSKGVDAAAQTVEKIADAVGDVAEQVDKAAEELGEALPEGGLKQVVDFVEDMAEETVKDAQAVEDLMDKVEKLDDKLEELLDKEDKGPGNA